MSDVEDEKVNSRILTDVSRRLANLELMVEVLRLKISKMEKKQ